MASDRRALRFDPRTPQAGVIEVSPGPTASVAPSPWQAIARMPASNHDITAALVSGRLYIAGGLTGDWSFPARDHAFDEVWTLDPTTWNWTVAVKLAQPRIYCATVAFENAVWIVSGDTMDKDGTRRTSTLVEIFGPQTGTVIRGPDVPFPQPRPLALVARGRLYVMGTPDRAVPGRMDSIGPGENTWRREPDGPPAMWALAGASLDERLYVCLPEMGLGMFDPITAAWEVIGGPTQPRSAQVAAWRGELWIMGGVSIPDETATRIFNARTRTWRLGPPMPRPLAWGAAAVVNDCIIVTGGAGRIGGRGRFNYEDRTFVLREKSSESFGF